ncbi:hypothetical protein F511_09081 [Dorcoceras hygrometricum]|nr:hypothetical protein F511_09081 [Dorcoceras hygrometricum]
MICLGKQAELPTKRRRIRAAQEQIRDEEKPAGKTPAEEPDLDRPAQTNKPV